MTFVSYAQNFEDVMLWRALSSVQQGFYIDVGASEPVADSVTAAFYERGWSGINIEPMTESFNRLTESRDRDINLQLALEEKPGTALYFSVENGNGISTGVSELGEKYAKENWNVNRVSVTVSTLRDICETYAKNRAIHFLKIDVEGNERKVLLGGDFSKFRPWIVLVEATLPNSQVPTHENWEELLLTQGYSFAYFDGLNRFYISDEKLDLLKPNFLTPPNWFDHFICASEALARQNAAGVGVQLSQQAQEISALQSKLEEGVKALSQADMGWRAEKEAREQVEQRLTQSHMELQAQLNAANKRLSDFELAQNALNSQIESYYQESFESSRLIAWLSQERFQLNRRLLRSENSTEAQIASIRATLSWRITRPLRLIRKFLSRQK